MFRILCLAAFVGSLLAIPADLEAGLFRRRARRCYSGQCSYPAKVTYHKAPVVYHVKCRPTCRRRCCHVPPHHHHHHPKPDKPQADATKVEATKVEVTE